MMHSTENYEDYAMAVECRKHLYRKTGSTLPWHLFSCPNFWALTEKNTLHYINRKQQLFICARKTSLVFSVRCLKWQVHRLCESRHLIIYFVLEGCALSYSRFWFLYQAGIWICEHEFYIIQIKLNLFHSVPFIQKQHSWCNQSELNPFQNISTSFLKA